MHITIDSPLTPDLRAVVINLRGTQNKAHYIWPILHGAERFWAIRKEHSLDPDRRGLGKELFIVF